MDKKGGREAVSHFSIEKILPCSTGNIGRGALLCFRLFVVSKNFFRREDITNFSHQFPLDHLMSHSTEIFVGEHFNVSESVG